MITLGGLTPSVDVRSRGSGSKLLSSFAASPTLRKRSSQTGSSQRSNSSGRGKSNTSQGPTSQGSNRSDANDSMDWPDDFPLGELDGALDDEPSGISGAVTVPVTRGSPSHRDSRPPMASRSPVASHHPPAAASAASAAAPLPIIHDDGDEDDLDHLLDGIDEAELFNI
ncbi:hypothetical protein BGX24_002676 [Mortierella sp. AD032]|nr:hypothetical protein BGX24_002676 [Mortierella sp. AD032]